LQIDQANRVTGAPRRRSNKFETERFETKVDLRVHQAAGMNGEELHLLDPLFLRVMFGVRAYLKTFQSRSTIPATSTVMLKMISEQASNEY
jgi:hypothetical protein